MICRMLSLTLLATLMATSAVAGNNPPEGIDRDWYVKHYDFYTIPDTFFTYEGEFIFPEGFHRPDSSSLTPFQFWMSHFPTWHGGKSVGAWGGGRYRKPDSVSRVVHFPWHTRGFTDCGIPIRLMAEFLRYQHREFDLEIIPKNGATITYEEFLKGKAVYSNRGVLRFDPDEPRDTSVSEYNRCMYLGMHNTTYRSLTANCDSITPDELAPGDLLVGHDEKSKEGFTYVIMNMLVNDEGDKIYTFATGCPKICDFHVPLVSEDRRDPWLTVEEIIEYAPEFEHTGFFRLRLD